MRAMHSWISSGMRKPSPPMSKLFASIPTTLVAYNGKGNALRNLNRNEEALAAYEQAIRLDPNYALAYDNKGDTLKSSSGMRKLSPPMSRLFASIPTTLLPTTTKAMHSGISSSMRKLSPLMNRPFASIPTTLLPTTTKVYYLNNWGKRAKPREPTIQQDSLDIVTTIEAQKMPVLPAGNVAA